MPFARRSGKALRIAVSLDGTAIEQRIHAVSRSIRIGRAAGNEIVVPSERLPATQLLFGVLGERFQLALSPGMTGEIAVGGRKLELGELASVLPPGAWIPLADSARGVVRLGEVAVVFERVEQPAQRLRPKVPRELRPGLWRSSDRAFVAILVAVLLLDFGVARAITAPALPPDETAFEEPLERSSGPLLIPKPPKPETPKHVETASRGTRAAPAKSPSDLQMMVRKRGLLGQILGARGELAKEMQGLLEPNHLGRRLDEALADSRAGQSTAELEGPRRRGGENGAVESIGPLETTGGAHRRGLEEGRHELKATIAIDDPMPTGGCDAAAIGSVMRSRLRGFQACYERELKNQPTVGGRVVVRFSVTPAGGVADFEVEESAIPGARFRSCLKTLVNGWRFPPQGEECSVVYPFVFARVL